jgi:cation diffusion facilitator family transporter
MQSNQIKRKKRLILAAFLISVVLGIVKFIAYYLTQSNAILSDALESLINVVASGFALYSVRLASLPKDHNHPYGHGKIEFLSAGFEGGLILLASLLIGYQAIFTLFFPVTLTNLTTGSVLLVISLIVNGGLGALLVREGTQLHSITLQADGKHLLADAYTSIALLVSLVLIQITGLYWIDSLASLLFGAIIAYNGFRLVRKSVAGLMDESDAALLEKIVNELNMQRKPHWVDVHNLRVQQYGADLHIDCHLTLPHYWELTRVHDAIVEFEGILKANHHSETEIFVHADPCLPRCCSTCCLADCAVRSQPFEQLLAWHTELIVLNQKHVEYDRDNR